MGVWTHVATYQGYPCKAVSFRRSPGLEPDHGYVDIDLKHMRQISLQGRSIAWRSSSGSAFPSPLSIAVWSKNRATVTAPPEQAAPSAGGLSMFGDLVLESFLDGKSQGQVRYRDIYVSKDGVEELGPVPAARREHNTGTVRVRITDIRAYYGEEGAFLGGINVRVDTGTGQEKPFDSTTINGETPWNARDVFGFLFAMLPGSPTIDSQSDLFRDGLDANVPTDIIGEGEPVKPLIARLLDRYGLQPCLLPDNTYMLNRPVSSRIPAGQIAKGPSSFIPVKYVRDERKTVSPTGAPRAVLVVGRRPIRRFSCGMIPVFKNPDDDRIYPLDLVDEVFDYPLEKVKKEVFSGAKNFRDVPPKNRRKGFLRGQALKRCAYRMYAPAFLFNDESDPGISEEDLAQIPWLPIVDAPWRKTELANIGVKPIGQARKRGDDWLLHKPIVMGMRFGQGFFTDFEELDRYFKERSRSDTEARAIIQDRLNEVRKQIRLAGGIITRPNDSFRENYNAAKAAGLGIGRLIIAASLDAAIAINNKVGVVPIKGNDAEEQTAELSFRARFSQERLQKVADGLADSIRDIDSTLREQSRHWEARKDVFRAMGGIQVWKTLPHGVIESGYSIDPRTGIIQFSEPVCMVDQSFLLQPEGATVSADGAVIAIWGYEEKGWDPLSWTSALYVADEPAVEDAEKSSKPKVVCAGINRMSNVTPRVEKEPKMRLYTDERGEPMNLTEVATAGLSRAEGILSEVKAGVGFTYELQYFQEAVLESGVSSVQYDWDSKARARAATLVMVNAPGGKGIGGVARANAKSNSGRAVSGEDAIRISGGE